VDITTRTHPTSLPAPMGLTAVPNAERVTLTAQVAGNLYGLTYRWLCHECYWKNRNTDIIEETSGTLTDEGLDSGTYIIKLLVLDSNKRIIGSAAKVVTIQPNSPPVANFTITPQEVALGSPPEIKLDATTSSDPDGGQLVKYIWSIANGSLSTEPETSSIRTFKPTLIDAMTTENTLDFTFGLNVTDDENALSSSSPVVSNLQVILPKAQFTVTQNGTYIGLDGTTSTGASFSPSQKASTIQKYEWELDGNIHYVGSGTDPKTIKTEMANMSVGKHTISLEITDSYGYTGKMEREVLIAPKTIPGTALNAQGGPVSTSSKFSALLLNSTVAVAQQLEIPISFQIDAEDVGETIDLLLVVGVEPPPQSPKTQYTGGVETIYHAIVPETTSCRDAAGNQTLSGGYCYVDLYAEPDVWMARLTEPYEKVKTAEANIVRTLKRGFSAGMHYIFAGYRRPDSTIVYSAQPVAQFEVK